MFYTYAHYTPQGRLFYIGKGTGRRATAEVSRNRHWRNVVQKYGKPEVQILADWKTQEEALEHEQFLIMCFRKMGYQLCNITNGGEGTTAGIKLSSEHKQKISAALKGRPGKIPSAETREKLRTSHLGQKAWSKGLVGVIKHSDATKAKISAASRGHTWNVKYKYIGVNPSTFDVVEFIGNASMKLAGFDPARIRDCADGKRKSHKKYTWRKEPIGGKNANC